MPADIADQAQDIIEASLSKSLAHTTYSSPPFSGSCLFCEEPVENARFCGPECRDDYESELKRNRITRPNC